jgi:hypothetical protein
VAAACRLAARRLDRSRSHARFDGLTRSTSPGEGATSSRRGAKRELAEVPA